MCGICKKETIVTNETIETKTESKKVYKTCSDCREKLRLKRQQYKCEHGRQRSKCKECGGSEICEHGKRRSTCKDCGGASICEHGRQRSHCKECGGASICEHGRQRSKCKECGGASICEHGRERSKCIICRPKCGCQNCHSVYVGSRSKFHPYCFRCYCILNPDADIPRKYKFKEHYLREKLQDEFKDVKLVFDKRVGESGKKPDVLIDCGTHCIVTECDENCHTYYTCEEKREMQIFQDLGNRPLVMIRFNPDSYKEDSGRIVPSCFTMTKTAGWKVDKTEWERRTNELINIVKTYMEEVPTKDYTRIELFYGY